MTIEKRTETDNENLPKVPKLAFSMTETCASIGVSRVTLWRLIKRGLIHPLKVTRTVLIPRQEIERFLRDNIEGAA